MFRDDPRTIRYGVAENLYGYDEIEAFRAARSPSGLRARIEEPSITTYGRDFAVASTLFQRDSAAGKIGRQMQTWVRFDEGWRVVAAHVSVIDEPDREHADEHSRAVRSAIARLAEQRPHDAGRGAAAAACRRDRARRARARHGARRDGACARVSTSRARRCARRSASSRRAAWSRRAPHRGAVVARPDEERLVGMFEAMAELERCARALPPSA